MRSPWYSRLVLSAAAGVALVLAPTGASAQPAADASVSEPTNQELLDDFLHYLRISSYELAEDLGQQLLDRDLTPIEFLGLVEDGVDIDRFLDAIAMARRPQTNPRLRAIAEAFDRLYERGRLDRARSPAEITRNIDLLTSTARGRILGRQRLIFAGEYAIPQLLGAFLQRENLDLRGQARQVLIGLGRQAVMPLVTALPKLDPARQELVVNVLAQIEYETAVPFIYELREQTASAEVRMACDRAMAQLLGGRAITGDVAWWFYDLAERYYAEKAEVTSFPGEENQLVWSYDPRIAGSGLSAMPVRTEVYHEAMAMAMCERSLAHRTAENDALPLWIASNFSREIDTPPGYENPAYPSTRREAMFFAVGSGVHPSQWVLARAIDTRDTPLARRAIAALDQTAGDVALRSAVLIGDGNADRHPLLDALRYPNRRVQYEAALALARSQPTIFFDGSQRVVPLLASAVRDASRRVAVVLTNDRERSDALRAMLQARGYEVFAGRTLSELAAPMAQTPGVDIVLMDFPADEVRARLDRVRADDRLLATPVLVLSEGVSFGQLRRRLERDETVLVRREGISTVELDASIDHVMEIASGGPITDDEARSYATRSLDAMRDLAVSGNAVFDVADAALPMIATLNETSGSMRFKVAEILSRIGQDRVQSALMEAALSSEGIEKIELLSAVSASAKRFGNLLAPRQVEQLVELTLASRGAEATAASALMGALSLPSERLMPLIVQDDQTAVSRKPPMSRADEPLTARR